MKTQLVITAVVLGAALLISFVAGFLFREAGSYGGSPEVSSVESVPEEDVPGEDVAGLPRYPGSVRVKYESHDLGDARVREVGYVTEGRLGEVEDFYERRLGENGWSLRGSDFDGGEVGMRAGRDGAEALVEIEREGGLVGIDVEVSGPVRR